MVIETVDDLTDEIANWLDIYSCCKSTDTEKCENNNIFCCRVNFVLVLSNRIRNAVNNENELNKINLK